MSISKSAFLQIIFSAIENMFDFILVFTNLLFIAKNNTLHTVTAIYLKFRYSEKSTFKKKYSL